MSSEAEKFGRVVVLAEEFMLADVLSLGLQPIASSATVHDAGFQGLDDFATNSIEILPMTTLSLERLAALRPDTIITSDFWAEQTDTKILDGIAARTISVSDRLSASDRIVELGDALGRQAEAASLVAEFDIVVASAREALKADECVITVATVYPGPRLATFIEPIWDIPGSAPSDPMLETISLQE